MGLPHLHRVAYRPRWAVGSGSRCIPLEWPLSRLRSRCHAALPSGTSALRAGAGSASIPYLSDSLCSRRICCFRLRSFLLGGAVPLCLGGALSGCSSISDPLALEGPHIQRRRKAEKGRFFSNRCKLTTVTTQSSASEKRGR